MEASAGMLPPGPRLPKIVQTLAFMFAGRRFLDGCRRRYGDVVTMSTAFDSRFVMVFDPDLLKKVFQAPPDRLRAGEANALLGQVLGQRSVLVLVVDQEQLAGPQVETAVDGDGRVARELVRGEGSFQHRPYSLGGPARERSVPGNLPRVDRAAGRSSGYGLGRGEGRALRGEFPWRRGLV